MGDKKWGLCYRQYIMDNVRLMNILDMASLKTNQKK